MAARIFYLLSVNLELLDSEVGQLSGQTHIEGEIVMGWRHLPNCYLNIIVNVYDSCYSEYGSILRQWEYWLAL